jgi:RNA polymerase sigma-70 factor (ECF subfamily)
MDALGELFQRYTHLVYGTCMNYLHDDEAAKDATMQIFENFIDHHPVKPITNFKNWLFVVAKNHCLMIFRQNKHVERLKADNLHELQPEFMEFDSNLHHLLEESKVLGTEEVHEAINHLAEEQKVCVQLFFLEGMSYKDISEKTGYNQNQVKSYIQNGKRNLKIILDNGTAG